VSSTDAVGNPRVISRAIVELGRALGLEIVVEGIESQSQADWFGSLGCQYAQGYYFAEPLTPSQTDIFLSGGRHRAALPTSLSQITPITARVRRRPAVNE
jgi:EAL domain-containing protein (putative c-di-GMP-specific phosphodiesterase class I)